MNILENVLSALSGIMSNKMRALLTMFGIIVGISSVIMIISIGEGYKASIQKQFEDSGLNNMTLRTDRNETIEQWDYLTQEDADNLRNYEDLLAVSSISSVYISDAVTLLDTNSTRSVYIRGVDSDFFQINKVKLASGRYFTQRDVEAYLPTIIIDEDFAKQIFGHTDVLGERISVQTYSSVLYCNIIGLTASNNSSQMGITYNMAADAYLPITAVKENFWDSGTVDSIQIRAAENKDLRKVSDNVLRLTEFKHENKGKYQVSLVADNLDQANTIIGMFTLFLGFVAGISLLVGGIGVMNIMLVSVTERTREIGIRKSLGAFRRDIMLQFLIEAVILTAIGGAVGILLGYLGGVGIGTLATMMLGETVAPYLSKGSIIFVVGISASIGILFGVYPAGQAAKLDPIEALRFES